MEHSLHKEARVELASVVAFFLHSMVSSFSVGVSPILGLGTGWEVVGAPF